MCVRACVPKVMLLSSTIVGLYNRYILRAFFLYFNYLRLIDVCNDSNRTLM